MFAKKINVCSQIVFWLDLSAYDWLAYVLKSILFDYINFFNQNLGYVDSVSLSSKNEGILMTLLSDNQSINVSAKSLALFWSLDKDAASDIETVCCLAIINKDGEKV